MRYLSEAWIEAAHAAVGAAAATAPEQRVIVDQHVDDVASYRVVVERDASSVLALSPADDTAHDTGTAAADATFRQDAATARAVALGDTDAHQAFLLGHIRFEGDINLLIERREAFTWLAETLAPVLAATTFD